MKRSTFVSSAAFALLAPTTIARVTAASDPFDPRPGAWRTFEVTTTVTLAPGEAASAWVPVASFAEASWMRPAGNTFDGDARSIEMVTDPASGAEMVRAQWPASKQGRRLVVRSTVKTNDLDVNTGAKTGAQLAEAQRRRYLAGTKYIPVDGLVLETAQKITAGAQGDDAKAYRIYNWIVENTYRKATVRGCGLGNIEFLLQTGDLGGKCADLNGLAVGLARASGIPARDLYGIRVAPSRFGYKSLGANSTDVTHGQHCRAEFFLAGTGWVPFDPADVRKVILEEPPGHLDPKNAKVVDARQTLFGAWEGNYMAYNDAHDVALPGSSGDTVPFLMYPQAEIAGTRLDSLDPATFTYAIDTKQLA